MPNRILIEELNQLWVCEQLCDVTDENMAWVLLQEPGFIGFGVVMKDNICFPPGVEPDWTLTSDLRLFGKKGEWHVWRDWDGNYYARLLKPEDIDDAFTEYHVLWGDWPPKPGQSPWMKLTETRGTEIWLPIEDSGLTKSDFPLRLKLKQVIGYDDNSDDSRNKSDNNSHLAGIIDAALVALVDRSCQKVLYPPFPSCLESNKAEAEASCSSGDTSAVPS